MSPFRTAILRSARQPSREEPEGEARTTSLRTPLLQGRAEEGRRRLEGALRLRSENCPRSACSVRIAMPEEDTQRRSRSRTPTRAAQDALKSLVLRVDWWRVRNSNRSAWVGLACDCQFVGIRAQYVPVALQSA